MNKLKITYDKPVEDELVDRVGELVDNWNDNADNHFGIASDIGDGSFSNESRETLLLDFVKADILDAIDDKEDYEWKINELDPDIWYCGRSGSHVWLHLNHRRVLIISCQDPEEIEDLNPVMEWKYMKWVLALIILMLLVKLVDNFLI